MNSNPKKPLPFSLKQAAVTLQHKATPDGLYVQDILATFGSRGHAFCILFFTLPFVQPVPLLGLSTPFGILLMTFGYLVLVNKPLWLPQKILKRHLPAKIILSCCSVLIRILDKTEKLIRPRFSGWTTNRYARIFNGVLIIVFAFLLSLPLPIPFSNSIPALFLVINSLGELEEDGALMWLSYLVAMAGAAFFFGLGAGMQEAFDYLNLKFSK